MSPFTSIFMVYFLIVVIIKACIFRITGEGGGTLKDNWTFPAIFISYLIAAMGSLSEYFLRTPRVNLWLSFVGYLLATGGLMITCHCVKVLGRWWSVRIEIKRNHKVVEDGPYRISRHPYYLATLLELGGLSLILNSLRALLYVILVHSLFVLARILREERVLVAYLGAPYLDYKKRVGVLPFVSG